MLNRRPLTAALAIAFAACATPPQLTRDTGSASASGSARRSVLPLIHVPSKCHYLHHVQLPQRAATTTAVEETATALADDAGTTFTLEQHVTGASPKDELFATSVHRLDARGFLLMSSVERFPGKPPDAITYEPPRLILPSDLTAPAPWTVRRYDGGVAHVVVELRSSFCADGVASSTSYTFPNGRFTIKRKHFCSGDGWRGEEVLYKDPDGTLTWMWTTDLTCEGRAFADPPLSARFPEGAP